MGRRLADQVVTFPLGGENARCGNAMCRERLDQLWRGERLFPFCIPFLFILTLSAWDGLRPNQQIKLPCQELGQLRGKPPRVCPGRGIQANWDLRRGRVQVDLLLSFAADLLLNWFLALFSLREWGDHSYQVITVSLQRNTKISPKLGSNLF